jgi:hypothetical protein
MFTKAELCKLSFYIFISQNILAWDSHEGLLWEYWNMNPENIYDRKKHNINRVLPKQKGSNSSIEYADDH